MLEHHLVGLPSDTGLLVAAEGRMCRIGVIAVRPHTSRLNGPAHSVAGVDITRPDTGAKAIERVVGNPQSLGLILEGRHGDDRPEDLLLKHAHSVVSFEYGRLCVESVLETLAHYRPLAAGEHLGSFLACNVEIGEDLLQLLARGLCANHGGWIQWISLFDLRDTFQRAFDEALVDRLLDQGARWAGAHLALVEREH